MNNYYIKYIWGPGGQIDNYPNKEIIHFAKGQKSACERFKNCDGFLVYETGSKKGNVFGAKAIYAYGIIAPNQAIEEYEPQDRKHGDKHWIYGVKIDLKKRVDPKDGVPLDIMKKVTGVTMIWRPGGLLKISKEQFDELYTELEKCF